MEGGSGRDKSESRKTREKLSTESQVRLMIPQTVRTARGKHM